MYDIVPYIAEIYDELENYTDDVELIRSLIQNRGPLKILEPFCGTRRILIPLAQNGHTLTGMDVSPGMLGRAWNKLATLDREVQNRVDLVPVCSCALALELTLNWNVPTRAAFSR